MKKYQNISYSQIHIENGFWKERQDLNRKVTAYSVWKRFTESGRFDAFRMDWKEGMPNEPHFYWDSDVAKLLEGAAYIIRKSPDPELERMIEETVDLIAEHQGEDGYFNVWFTVVRPDARFQIRNYHELYCAGHLIEAAVAYYEATGRDKFLKCMCRYADYIAKVFVEEGSANFETPGHEEIELALVRLYRCTGEEKYLRLSQWFLDRRGVSEKDAASDLGNTENIQSHMPIRNMEKAEGHAVRAGYLYSAMADMAYEQKDEELLAVCRRIFKNIVEKRMYITGGIGSTRFGEAFTRDYDLPNNEAYAETCAAVALAMFGLRMLRMEADSVYADTVERVLYNGFLSGTSLSGKSFFYVNPLEINVEKMHFLQDKPAGGRQALTERLELFDCSCCPPNVVRFVAGIADYMYTHDTETLFVHQYMDSRASFVMGEGEVQVTQCTNYPAENRIRISAEGMTGKSLAVRIPGWCPEFRISDGIADKKYGVNANRQLEALETNADADKMHYEKGYLYIACDSDSINLELEFTMEPVWMEPHTAVYDNAGLAALQYGPVVYCMEGIDQCAALSELYADADLQYSLEKDEAYPVPALIVNGWKKLYDEREGLYRVHRAEYEPVKLRFVPYYTFANRGESDMQVWVKVRG